MKLINSLRVLLQIELIAGRKIYGATCAELDGHGAERALLLPKQRQTDGRAEVVAIADESAAVVSIIK